MAYASLVRKGSESDEVTKKKEEVVVGIDVVIASLDASGAAIVLGGWGGDVAELWYPVIHSIRRIYCALSNSEVSPREH